MRDRWRAGGVYPGCGQVGVPPGCVPSLACQGAHPPPYQAPPRPRSRDSYKGASSYSSDEKEYIRVQRAGLIRSAGKIGCEGAILLGL